MPDMKNPVRLLMTAALAASTTLTGQTFAFAERNAAFRLAQADPAEAVPKRPRKAPPETDAEEAPAGEKPQSGKAPSPAEEAGPDEAPRIRRGQREAQPETGGQAPAAEQPQHRQRREAAPATDAVPAEAPNAPRRQAQPEAAPEDAAQPDGVGKPRRERPKGKAPAPAAAEQGTPEPAAKEVRPEAPVKAPKALPVPAGKMAPATTNTSAPAAAPAGEMPAKPKTSAPAPAPPKAAAPTGAPKTVSGAAAAKPSTAPDASGAAPPPPPPAATLPKAPPAGEMPAKPAAPAVDPAQPSAATLPGAPDATTAVPGSTVRPPPGGATLLPVPSPSVPGTRPAAPGEEAPTADQTPPAPRPTESAQPRPVPADVQNAPVDPRRIDRSDARVQTLRQQVDVRPVRQEQGERIGEAPTYDLPPDAKVARKVGDREILSLGAAAVAGAVAGAAAGYFVRPNDDERLGADASDRYTERLPGGRTRETIVRPNGVQVVTISNRYGDVVQRSRVMPDGREVVLFYDPSSGEGQNRDYYDDPGRDLPPVRVDIPEDRYVVDVDEPDEELYYDTLIAPPVETVERIYSVDEVRRSVRIREKVRRIDLATINFDFASAEVAQGQVDKLQSLAEAVQTIIKANPGETFLIEGHTDAVGGDVPNLALSDRRAESVASALTQYFDVPAENLVTQGYGEQELKVNTQGESRENRRVTVRRITALVKPVTTSQAR